MFGPESDWKPPDLSSLPSWPTTGRVGLDIEARDPHLDKKKGGGISVRRGGYVTGVSFGFTDGFAKYTPTAQLGGGNLPADKVYQYYRDQAARFEGELVLANASFDLDYLAELGIVFKRAKIRDVLNAAPLLWEHHDSYRLDAVAKRAGLEGKNETLLRQAAEMANIDPKKDLWQLPASVVGPYAEQDALEPLKVYTTQYPQLEKERLLDIWNLESELLPILIKMRRRGVKVDFDQLDRVEAWALAKCDDHLAEIAHLTGHRLSRKDLNKSAAKARPLEHVGIRVPLTDAGNPSVSKELLESIDHPVGLALRKASGYLKTSQTFATSVRIYAVKGRVHPEFVQVRRTKDDGTAQGATPGRLSCVSPNLQQQPSGRPPFEELGPMWRAIYVPDDPDSQWGCFDYSQQEPRMMAADAERLGCTGGAAIAERYRQDPNTDNHTMMAEITGLPRKIAKNIFLGKCYAMGGARFAQQVGLPIKVITKRSGKKFEAAGDEAAEMLRIFDEKVPYVRELAKKAEAQANKLGYIRTILGRKCRFTPAQLRAGKAYKALNRRIQGSSADQMKKAMILAEQAGFKLRLQVHDEVDKDILPGEDPRELAQIMMDAVPSTVPFWVDVETGPNWGEIS